MTPLIHPAPGAAMSDVLILGAGFSRALSERMPLTNELGNLALDQARLYLATPPPDFQKGDFEAWLSRLADDQPDLLPEENLENRARFVRLSRAIRTVLDTRQAEALAGGVPSWLDELLGTIHVRRIPVLTLNYDTLVEHTVQRLRLSTWTGGTATWHDILDHLPPLLPGWLGVDRNPDTFRLIKLHGSLNWLISQDVESAQVLRWSDLTVDPDDAMRRAPATDPFVVPPSAAKSPYYRIPFVRQLWRRAAAALRSASYVALLGYSVPEADLVVSGMLRDACEDRGVRLEVVNLDNSADQIMARLKTVMAGRAEVVRLNPGPDPIERWSNQYRDTASRELGEAIADVEPPDGPELPVLVAWSESRCAAVIRVEHDGSTGDTKLQLERADQLLRVARQRETHEDKPVQVRALTEVHSRGRRIVAVDADGNELVLVAATYLDKSVLERPKWQVLVPCAWPA
ncbi:MAG TPA: hypothetical protein VGS21_12100 [Acidimicrobiales bacterium]|nr:hypothetical protein [Acidimicrobiales bacterium]